jgi:hypothetical protein
MIMVCLLFVPKVAIAYGFGESPADSNPWRFVKGDSGSSGSKVKSSPDGQIPSKQNVKSTQDGSLIQLTSPKLLRPTSNKRSSKDGGVYSGGATSPSEALANVLKDDPIRRRFRRYLQALTMDENVRFWDSVIMFRSEPDDHKRFVSARAIILTFVLDTAPLQSKFPLQFGIPTN